MPRTMNKIYHIGFAVPRLEEAMEEYSKIFGITFRAPRLIPLTQVPLYVVCEAGRA
jgi:predicted enzyme related to lactoylglutathione lyase